MNCCRQSCPFLDKYILLEQGCQIYVQNVRNVNFVTTINFIPDVDTELIKERILGSMIQDIFQEPYHFLMLSEQQQNISKNKESTIDIVNCQTIMDYAYLMELGGIS